MRSGRLYASVWKMGISGAILASISFPWKLWPLNISIKAFRSRNGGGMMGSHWHRRILLVLNSQLQSKHFLSIPVSIVPNQWHVADTKCKKHVWFRKETFMYHWVWSIFQMNPRSKVLYSRNRITSVSHVGACHLWGVELTEGIASLRAALRLPIHHSSRWLK